MSVIFTTDRKLPKELRMNGYSDAGQDIVNFVSAASPWEFLKGIFVDKPRAEQEAQLELAQIQSQSAAATQAARGESLRRVLLIGGGVAGLLVLVMLVRGRRSSVGGYRRKRRSRRSRR